MAVTETVTRSVVLPQSLWERLDKIAAANDRRRAAEMRRAIREYVERHEAQERGDAA